MLDKLFSILAADWLISSDTVLSYLPTFIAFLNGGKFDLQNIHEKKPSVMAFNMDGTPQPINIVKDYCLEDPTIPENSLAIIPIQDVILSWKTMQLINDIKAADQNPQINSILFAVSSPGGMTSQLDIASKAIKDLSIPSVAVIFEMCASAAMWLTSAMTYRIATSPMDQVGSIGTKASFNDFSGLLKEKIGINITDFYATKSVNKDGAIRAFLANGDKAPITAKIDFINEYFHSQIQSNLGIKPESEVFSGDIYYAEKAKELGLINEINTMDYALSYAYTLGLTNKITTFSNNINR
jgi:ClpP class serine protease